MADQCILCGKCLEVCPLLRATDREELSPRTKADLARLLAQHTADLNSVDVARLASLCLGCHRCASACSQGVDVLGLVAALRQAHPDFKQWLWKTWLTKAPRLWSASATAAGLIPERLHPEKLGPFLKLLAGLKGGPGLEPFLTTTTFPDTYRGKEVLLFAGCTATYVQGRWLMTALRLLDGLGMEVLHDDFQCCGAGLKSAGCIDEAQDMAQHNVDVWNRADRPPVVTFCASCRAGLLGYDQFLGQEEGQAWVDSVMSLSTLVRDIDCVTSDKTSESLGYHRPCHAGGADADLAFLRGVLGARLTVPSGHECCGFGGLLRLSDSALADRVGVRCIEHFEDHDVVLTGCSACVTQLGAISNGGVAAHWLEIIK